jgi:hypothetical protein
MRKSPLTSPCPATSLAGVSSDRGSVRAMPPCFALHLRREYGPRRPEKVKWFPDAKTPRHEDLQLEGGRDAARRRQLSKSTLTPVFLTPVFRWRREVGKPGSESTFRPDISYVRRSPRITAARQDATITTARNHALPRSARLDSRRRAARRSPSPGYWLKPFFHGFSTFRCHFAFGRWPPRIFLFVTHLLRPGRC